jgi:NAD(P)-dependent dehydrogenase (short-subunit alcohol dehydrogenase family)
VLGKSFPSYGAYIASKAGVEGLMRVLANELPRRVKTVRLPCMDWGNHSGTAAPASS